MAKYDVGDESGLGDMERALEVALSIDSPVAATIVNNLGVYGIIGGDVTRADDYYREAYQLAERFGDKQTVRFVRANQIWASFMRGRWDEAQTNADTFIAECEGGSPHTNEFLARDFRASLREARGDPDGALADRMRALELVREARETIHLAGVLALLASTYADRGQFAHAEPLMDEAIPLIRQYGAHGSLISVAPFAEQLGIRDELRAAIEEAPRPAQYKWLQAILLGLDGDQRVTADFLAELGSPALEARFRLHAGEQLLRNGRANEGIAELQRALSFYVDVRAPSYVARIESALASAQSASA